MHHDERGWFTEIFREAWDIGVQPVQWNMVFSQPGTLRGVHVHLDHYDYLIVPQGEMVLGLKDLRRASPTYGLSALCTLSEANLESYLIPPGVGHGFYFPVASLHCYAVSAYWNKADEMGCRWDDAGLGLAWPVTTPTLSDQDRAAPSLEALMARLHQHDFPRFW
jgi:dTDP-4-dehydrorhamnose 3,5-epimerase